MLMDLMKIQLEESERGEYLKALDLWYGTKSNLELGWDEIGYARIITPLHYSDFPEMLRDYGETPGAVKISRFRKEIAGGTWQRCRLYYHNNAKHTKRNVEKAIRKFQPFEDGDEVCVAFWPEGFRCPPGMEDFRFYLEVFFRVHNNHVTSSRMKIPPEHFDSVTMLFKPDKQLYRAVLDLGKDGCFRWL